MIKVCVPASIANVNVGFDVLGLAISPIDGTFLGDSVSVENAVSFSLFSEGKFINKLPINPEYNIVYQCWQRFCNVVDQVYPVAMKLEKNVPIASGLGSSSCSIVASLMALNIYCGNLLSRDQLLILMGEMEGYVSGEVHFDNVAPCFLGGMQLILKEHNIISHQIPSFDDWLWVMAYPGYQVFTAEAREVLPAKYNRKDCIDHSRCLAGFVHACHTKQPTLAVHCMKDIIAEPYRVSLLPKFFDVRRAVIDIGALICGISGSGPTLFVLCDCQVVACSVSNWLRENYVKNNEGFVCICRLNLNGARIVVE